MTLPRKDLRQKVATDPAKTDRELFTAMSSDDTWLDGRLHEVLLYLAENYEIEVPACWQNVMDHYIYEVREQESCLNQYI